MTGVIAVAGIGGAPATSGGTVIPNALAWTSIVGDDAASSNNQTISGISAPMSMAATITGSGELYYVQNGTTFDYTGAFTAHNGDVISWGVELPGTTRSAGTVTVLNNSDGGAVLCAIPYHLAASGGN